MNNKFIGVLLSAALFFVIMWEITANDISNYSNIKYAGVRSSSYGIEPFPEPSGWQNAMETMSGYFKDSIPCGIWIVGRLEWSNKSCRLEFTHDNNEHYPNILFDETDKHERYLSHFDTVGIKVFLQVEPANADVNTLIDLVLNRYKHHESVIGFGIDVEWYRESEKPGWGIEVTDDEAKIWEEKVKSHKGHYRLFLKHWDRNWMPKNYRGNIVFVDDSQMLESFDKMLYEFVHYWADYFKPNTVFYQIGYPKDKLWWKKLDCPPRDIGDAIANKVEQDCGIFWVDFTLREIISTEKRNNHSTGLTPQGKRRRK